MSATNPAPPSKKRNSGYFIANDRKNDRQPNYRGKVDVDGREFLVSVWDKPARDGKAMFSIELTDPATLPPKLIPAAPVQQSMTAPPEPLATYSSPSDAVISAKPSTAEDKIFGDIFGGEEGTQW